MEQLAQAPRLKPGLLKSLRNAGSANFVRVAALATRQSLVAGEQAALFLAVAISVREFGLTIGRIAEHASFGSRARFDCRGAWGTCSASTCGAAGTQTRSCNNPTRELSGLDFDSKNFAFAMIRFAQCLAF